MIDEIAELKAQIKDKDRLLEEYADKYEQLKEQVAKLGEELREGALSYTILEKRYKELKEKENV